MYYANSDSDYVGCCTGKDAMATERSMGKEYYD